MIFKYIIEIVENIWIATRCWIQWVCSLLVIVQILCNKRCLRANNILELSGYGQWYRPGRALRSFYIDERYHGKNKVTVYVRQRNRKSQKKCILDLFLLLHQFIFQQITKTSRSCILIFGFVCTLPNGATYSRSCLTEILRKVKGSSCKAQQLGS